MHVTRGTAYRCVIGHEIHGWDSGLLGRSACRSAGKSSEWAHRYLSLPVLSLAWNSSFASC